MTRDYLESAKKQLETQHRAALDQAQALHGAVQALVQLIAAEDIQAAGGTLPAQGVTGPVFTT